MSAGFPESLWFDICTSMKRYRSPRQPPGPQPSHAAAFRALGHPARLGIVAYLAAAGDEVPAGRLIEAMRITGPTLTHHLDALRHAGILLSRKQQRFVYSRLNRAFLSDLAELLSRCSSTT